MHYPASRTSRWLAAVLLVAVALGGASARAEGDPLEYRLKAQRIGNLARFVEWPSRRLAPADAPFVIGVAGPDAMFEQLRAVLQDHPLKGHPVAIRHVTAKDDLTTCHILFIARSEKDHLEPLLRQVRREGVLTVGESENFLGHGGVMSLLNVEGSLRLQVSAEAVKRERLVVSSKLLQLALPPDFEVGASPEPDR